MPGNGSEHMVIAFKAPHRRSSCVKPYSVNGQELPDWRDGPSLAEYLQAMHKQGWKRKLGPSLETIELIRDELPAPASSRSPFKLRSPAFGAR
jgi:hypothetical protein